MEAIYLFIHGQFNAAFFTGEILTMYAILGIILPIFCRMSDRIVVIFATLPDPATYRLGKINLCFM